jgi:hypothetical protein
MGEVEEKKPMTMRVQEWRGLGKYPYNRLTLSKSLENCQKNYPSGIVFTGGKKMVQEIIFLVEEAQEGGYTARAIGYSIFTEGESLEEIRRNVREAVRCHFEEEKVPQIIRLHIVKDEVLPVWGYLGISAETNWSNCWKDMGIIPQDR